MSGPVAAQALKLLLLKSPQQFGLELQRDFANLVEEQRPLMRQFKTSDLLREGSRERALLVTEEFAFEQRVRDRGTIHHDERPLAPPAQLMDAASHQFLASTRFALDEDGRVRRRHDCDVS